MFFSPTVKGPTGSWGPWIYPRNPGSTTPPPNSHNRSMQPGHRSRLFFPGRTQRRTQRLNRPSVTRIKLSAPGDGSPGPRPWSRGPDPASEPGTRLHLCTESGFVPCKSMGIASVKISRVCESRGDSHRRRGVKILTRHQERTALLYRNAYLHKITIDSQDF